MMKSVAMREYPPEFYKAFGFVVYDETHNLGAFMSARTQGRFNARYKLAITATDVRRDGGDRVYHSYFGKPAFVRSMQAVDTEVQVLSYTSKKPPTGTKKASKLLALAHDFERNKIISDIARKWYREGHCPLFVTDHVHHAEILYKMFMASGIPENKIGLYTGGQTVDGVMSTTTKEYLDWAEKHASVFIATFGMMKEGIDIPKLDRGMDCTPRSDFEQVLGRIRRAYPGKTKAVWVTIRDRAVKSFEGAYFQRISSVNKLPNITVKKVELAHVLGP
jgi:superfamily II DNA or RNA helicase